MQLLYANDIENSPRHFHSQRLCCREPKSINKAVMKCVNGSHYMFHCNVNFKLYDISISAVKSELQRGLTLAEGRRVSLKIIMLFDSPLNFGRSRSFGN